MAAPKVLISDKLSAAAVQIFKDRGIDVDFQPDLGKDKDLLLAAIPHYDGLAIRSATKATQKIIEAATNLKVIGRAGIGTDNIDKEAASKAGIIVMNTPFGNMITTAEHAIAMMFAVARQIPEASASTHGRICLDDVCVLVDVNLSVAAPAERLTVTADDGYLAIPDQVDVLDGDAVRVLILRPMF